MELWVPVFAPFIVYVLNYLCGDVLTCWCGEVCNMCKVKENLVELRREWNILIAKRNDVSNSVKTEETKGRQQRLQEVEEWLSAIKAIEIDTNRLLQDVPASDASAVHQQLSMDGCWSTDNITTCFLGREVFKRLKEVRNLSSRQKVDVLVTGKAPPVVEVKPWEETVGLDKTLEKIWNSLKKDENRILGIYGMGGVGKTTLLTQINNKVVEVIKDKFDVVIWVKVSKDVDIKKIQDDIGKRLGLYDENWSEIIQSAKAVDIHRVLNVDKPRFVLLLDDLWEEVSLTDIGIPLQGKDYKVVLTTRSKNVCGIMGASENIEVECLAEKDAWDLFEQKARCGSINDVVLEIAKKIAAKCCGLPLALEVIGKTMASSTTLREWSSALDTLESFPREMEGTKKGIFQVLKLSYDNLEKKDAKCFQYCALFPKAYNIKQDELVEYWIGEGFIDESDGRERAKVRGYNTIKTLVKASLLLVDGESNKKVYMHDMIREMALWILSEFRDGERFVVKTDAGLSQLPYDADWTTVTKMSLMNNGIEGIPDDHELPNPASLITLFLQKNMLVYIVGKFFQVMSTLVVLDLSGNLNITELPTEISKLISLRLLNLSGTSIKNFPSGLRVLTELMHLNLESTLSLQSISSISGLLKLQVLRFHASGAALDMSLLMELDRLKGLQVLTITVREVNVLEAFLGSKLAGKTQGLYLEGLKLSGASLADIGALDSLHNLEMANCDITEWEGKRRDQYSPSTSSSEITTSNPWFKNLSAVVLLSCPLVKDLTWLIYAESLESLHVESLPKMEKLIKEENVAMSVKPFQNLQALRLHYLDELRSFYGISFPKLKQHKVDITDCRNLHERPSDSTSRGENL